MKKIFLNSVFSLVTGLFFSLAVCIVIIGYNIYTQEAPPEVTEHVKSPKDFDIINHQKLEGAARYTIQGTVKNISESAWGSVTLEARILASNAEVNRCETRVRGFILQEERSFIIECYKVAGNGLPDNITYDLTVKYGEKIVNI